MKVPASWSKPSAKTPANWATQTKTARQWSGSSVIRSKTAAAKWNMQQKIAEAWGAGTYPYDCFLPYDSVISYDGYPKPITTKAPRKWSNT